MNRNAQLKADGNSYLGVTRVSDASISDSLVAISIFSSTGFFRRRLCFFLDDSVRVIDVVFPYFVDLRVISHLTGG